jgi:hypothetical protein
MSLARNLPWLDAHPQLIFESEDSLQDPLATLEQVQINRTHRTGRPLPCVIKNAT